MKKESKTKLQQFFEHVNAHFNRLEKNPNQSLGISCESRKTETFIELMLQQNGYEVFSFDCDIYYKNKKPQLMSFFQTIKDQQNELKKPAILLKNGSILSLNHEDYELFYQTLKNGFNLSDESLFFPQDSQNQNNNNNASTAKSAVKLIRGCEHALPDNAEGVHFCPECGKPALVEEVNVHTSVNINTHMSSDGMTVTEPTQTADLGHFIPIFAVSRDYLPSNAHYTDILYPSGLSIEKNPQVKKIWEAQQIAKKASQTVEERIETLKAMDNQLNIQIQQAQAQVKKAEARIEVMQKELEEKFSHIKPFSIPKHDSLDFISHDMSHSNSNSHIDSDIKEMLEELENSESHKQFSKFLGIGKNLTFNYDKLKKADMAVNKKLLDSFPPAGGFVDSSPYDKVWGIHEVKQEGSFESAYKTAEGIITKDLKNLKNKKYKY